MERRDRAPRPRRAHVRLNNDGGDNVVRGSVRVASPARANRGPPRNRQERVLTAHTLEKRRFVVAVLCNEVVHLAQHYIERRRAARRARRQRRNSIWRVQRVRETTPVCAMVSDIQTVCGCHRRRRSPLPRRPWNNARASECSFIRCTADAVSERLARVVGRSEAHVVTLLITT